MVSVWRFAASVDCFSVPFLMQNSENCSIFNVSCDAFREAPMLGQCDQPEHDPILSVHNLS